MAGVDNLYLQPIVNGHVVPGILPVTVEQGGIRVSAKALTKIGISDKIGVPDGPGFRRLTGTGAARGVIDNAAQTILLTVPARDMLTVESQLTAPAAVLPTGPIATGSYVNYTLFASTPFAYDDGQTGFSMTGNLNGVFFSPWGALISQTQVNAPAAEGSDQPTIARLSTTYEIDDPSKPRVVRLGDVITAPPGWARANLMGGVQIATDYALQPLAITFPTPQVASTLAVPSAVSLLVNNAQAYRSNLGAGPFSLVGIPVISGLNEITVQTRNANGQIVSSTVPFYASTTMLRAGLTTYSGTAGYLRQNYGTLQDGYSIPALDMTVSHGITQRYTGTLHSEAAPGLALLGGSIETANILGDLTLSLSGSMHDTALGGLVSANYARSAQTLNLGAGVTYAIPGYFDLSADNGTPYPRLSWYASSGLVLPYDLGNVSLAYTRQLGTVNDSYLNGNDTYVYNVANNAQFLLLSYNRQFGHGISLTVSGSIGETTSNSGTTRTQGFSLNLNFPLGGTPQGTVSFGAGSNQTPTYAQRLSALPSTTTGFGAAVQNQTGDYTSRFVTLQQNTLATNLQAQVSQFNGQSSGQLQASGTVALVDGLHFSAPSRSAFALVDVGYPNVPVFLENRPMGKTGADGMVFVPGLVPYYPNTISVDPRDLPLSANVTTDQLHVAPPLYGGVIAKLHSTPIHDALIRVVGPQGSDLPAGSLIYLQGATVPTPIGYDGEALLRNPPSKIEGYVIYPGGKCALSATLTLSLHNYLTGVTVRCTALH